jgi:hypothetical protein
MAITDESRRYADNLRRKRRYLQGRGVNLRETIVLSDAVYVDDRIVVPGLHDDDDIISVLNMTDLVDVTGYLDDAGEFATIDIFTVNKGIRFTALRVGAGGNKIAIKAAADPAVSQPLSVDIGDYDTLFGTTGNPGKTGILVNLATDAAGVALVSAVNSAANVFVAIIDAQEATIGSAVVDLALLGTGATAWTATGPTALAGGASFRQGPTAAQLDMTDTFIRYTARTRGTDGNATTITHTAGGALAVAVIGTAITVTYVDDTTTVQEAIDAVNASATASALVLASLQPGADGTDVLTDNQGPTALAGGIDPGIQLSEVSSTKKLKVLWLTRDELDEN